ncbi:MAG: hypothetical protein KTR26_16945 [Flammeovirgaceae bacterium]|nr:hypothetical protein [Flammeovirgaceae bacterium]
MTSENYSLFRSYIDQNQALELEQYLLNQKIDCKLVDNSPTFDVTFANNPLDKNYQVLVNQLDFSKATDLLEKDAETDLEKIDKDYYLFDFTDEELLEILMKPDEWGEFDFILAQKLLKERGKNVNPEIITLLKKQRIAELSKPEENQTQWINSGYLMAFLGGIVGIMIGWYLMTYKKTLPNGEKIFAYSEKDRKHGRNILIIGIIFLVISFIANIYGEIISTNFYLG